MLQRYLLIIVTTLLFSSSSLSAGIISFSGLGAGGQCGLVVTEYEGPAFGFGGNFMVEFSLGRFGFVQYVPSLTFWFKADKWRVGNDRYEYLDGQIVMNLFDLKYIFPLSRYVIKPYAGFSPFPCVVVNIDKREINGDPSPRDGSDVDAGFNIFCGIDFPIRYTFVPFIEWRFMASQEWAMRLTGGFNFWF